MQIVPGKNRIDSVASHVPKIGFLGAPELLVSSPVIAHNEMNMARHVHNVTGIRRQACEALGSRQGIFGMFAGLLSVNPVVHQPLVIRVLFEFALEQQLAVYLIVLRSALGIKAAIERQPEQKSRFDFIGIGNKQCFEFGPIGICPFLTIRFVTLDDGIEVVLLAG